MEPSGTDSRFPAVSALMSRPCWLVLVALVWPAAMTLPPGPTAGMRLGLLAVLPSGPVGSHLVPWPALV